ncbi:MAG TPA: sugar ABC transporter substrate-binding protein [Thermoanaerobaculia bacterium]|nr:sugar ABC transporter substrate-binding protein [Thermoanaerobaculia bacterium]
MSQRGFLTSKFEPRTSNLFFLLALTLACTIRPAHQEHLKFWGLGHEGEVVAQLLPEFTRRTGIRVDVQQIPWTAAHEKLLTAFVGDATPDLAQMGNTWIPEFNAVGALDSLSLRLANSSIREGDYFPGIWATNVVDSVVYGIPWYVDTRVLFYRTDLVPNPPRTWDEWLAAMKHVKERRPNSYAILLPTNQWEEVTILALANHASLLNADGTEGAFRDPRFVAAFRFFVDIFRRGFAQAVANTQVANVYQGFAQGDFAMYITGPWNVGEFRKRLPPEMNGKWATAPMPAPRASDWPGMSMAGGSSLVIFRASKKKDAAWKLIEFLSEPAQQVRFYELTQDLPAHREAWKMRGVANDPPLAAFRQQLEHVAPLPRVPEWEQIATNIYQDGEATVRGRMTVEQAAADLDRKADHILAKRRWVLARMRGQ